MSKIHDRLNRVIDTLDDNRISQFAYRSFRDNTPVGDPSRWKTKHKPRNYKPGNARRKTVLRGNQIEANYPYAQRLEEGWSTQAPDGMTKPTLESVRQYVYAKLGIKI